MEKRTLGKTTIKVSAVGLGAVKFGRTEKVKYPVPFQIPSSDDLSALIREAKLQGINLIDTAPAYGVSEERIGRLIEGERDEWVISTKFGETFSDGESSYNFSSPMMELSVERSLKRLRTDYIDILFIHAPNNDLEVFRNQELLSALERTKASGKVKAIGASVMTCKGGLFILPYIDVLMVSLNLEWMDHLPVIERASIDGKGILIKKPFSCGQAFTKSRSNIVVKTLKYIFSFPGISSVLVGTVNPSHLREISKSFSDIRDGIS